MTCNALEVIGITALISSAILLVFFLAGQQKRIIDREIEILEMKEDINEIHCLINEINDEVDNVIGDLTNAKREFNTHFSDLRNSCHGGKTID